MILHDIEFTIKWCDIKFNLYLVRALVLLNNEFYFDGKIIYKETLNIRTMCYNNHIKFVNISLRLSRIIFN